MVCGKGGLEEVLGNFKAFNTIIVGGWNEPY
jgi:hypothetical protein